MHETADDLVALQALLDASHARAGPHLRSILTDEGRMTAGHLCEVLTGMCLLNLATVTAGCEPRVGAVDGHFHRGRWYFGSSHESLRFRHLRLRPAVSANHVRGEELTVVAHGRAVEIDVGAPEHAALLEQLVTCYGEDWRGWGAGAAYARIDAERLYAAYLPSAEPASPVEDPDGG